MVLLAARAGGGTGGGEGVLQLAGSASGGCGAWFDRLTTSKQMSQKIWTQKKT